MPENKPSLPSNVLAYGYGVLLLDRGYHTHTFIGIHTFARELREQDIIAVHGIVCTVEEDPDENGMVKVRGYE